MRREYTASRGTVLWSSRVLAIAVVAAFAARRDHVGAVEFEERRMSLLSGWWSRLQPQAAGWFPSAWPSKDDDVTS